MIPALQGLASCSGVNKQMDLAFNLFLMGRAYGSPRGDGTGRHKFNQLPVVERV